MAGDGPIGSRSGAGWLGKKVGWCWEMPQVSARQAILLDMLVSHVGKCMYASRASYHV